MPITGLSLSLHLVLGGVGDSQYPSGMMLPGRYCRSSDPGIQRVTTATAGATSYSAQVFTSHRAW